MGTLGRIRVRFQHLVALGMLAAAPTVASTPDQSSICNRAAVFAAAQTGVPVSVLKAITLTETGRNRGGAAKPWPWTVNMEGKGVWFETEGAARAYAQEHFKRGARSFDIGCFQLNYKWHGENFVSIDAMFDPAENALYAARYLAQLETELGDWELAAGAYHSRTPEYAERYRARFSSFRAQFLDEDSQRLRVVAVEPDEGESPVIAAQPLRVNTFPFLQSGGPTALGSLVPLTARSRAVSLFAGDVGEGQQ